ncbi:hypothetical protein KP77_32180 [Jeotgalibacillus alimentarius]|uniref:Uncharacterized protein n=1 Tax=Jeotgalibacillus alimentarius TaxID=135826 RepID=A0A0C2V3B8_9BACL|nr:hypothetical protein KP77_32180 [Jeotgalibacillus alimentarius]
MAGFLQPRRYFHQVEIYSINFLDDSFYPEDDSISLAYFHQSEK